MAQELYELGAASALQNADLFLVSQSDTGYKTTLGDIRSAVISSIDGDILPDANGTRSIGADGNRFAAVYADEVYVSSSSLYVNGKKVIEDVSSTMTFSTDQDQALELKTLASTAGTGSGSISLTSGNQVNMTADGDVAFTVSSNSGSTQGLSFSNQSTGGNITFSTPNGSAVFNHAVEIAGDLTVNGTTTTVNTETVTISDNLIQINSDQTGTPPTTLKGGIAVNRGDSPEYRFEFAEDSDTFRVGINGDTQAVATREDAPTDGGFAVWNDSEKRFDTTTSVPVFTSSTSFPTSPKAGDECFREDLDEFYKYTGAAWVQI